MTSYRALLGLVDSGRLRAISLAARSDVGRTVTPDEADPALVDLVEEPYRSVPVARDRLERLEGRLRDQGDRRAVFLTIYTNMTRAVQRSVERGAFADPAWMREYTRTFANYYREAFLAFEQGRSGAVPDPWRIAFGTATAGNALVAQDAFPGINAHINYDLGLAIRDVDVDPNARKRADHRTIDDILGRLIDAQQAALAELYAPGIDDVDAALGRFDESLSVFAMTEGREQAWRVGVVLAGTGSRLVEAYARWVLRTTAVGAAGFVLSPALAPDLKRALERVEREEFVLEGALDALDQRLAAVDSDDGQSGTPTISHCRLSPREDTRQTGGSILLTRFQSTGSPLDELPQALDCRLFARPATPDGDVLEVVEALPQPPGVVLLDVETRRGDGRLHNRGVPAVRGRDDAPLDGGFDRLESPVDPRGFARLAGAGPGDLYPYPRVDPVQEWVVLLPDRERGVDEVDRVTGELDVALAALPEVPPGPGPTPGTRPDGRCPVVAVAPAVVLAVVGV